MNNIAIKTNSVTRRARALKTASDIFKSQRLEPADHETTLPVNRTSKQMFAESQRIQQLFAKALETSSNQITEIGGRFLEIDTQMARTIRTR